MSAICARLSKGKVGVQRGRKTAGCPSFFAHRRGYGAVPAAGAATLPPSADGESPAEVQRKTPRPSGSNPPAAVRVPRSADAEKEPPVRVEPACGSSRAPLSRCRKGAARQGRTRLRQFVCPGQPAQKRSCPSGANPPAAVRVLWSPCAEKRKHRRIASTVLKVCTFTQIAAAYRHPYAPAPAGPVPDDRVR